MTYNLTLTPTSCSESGGWVVLKYYLSSSAEIKQLLFTYDLPAELGAAGVNITNITVHGYVRNGQNYNKNLRMGFRPAANSGVSTWGNVDGVTALDSAFRVIDRYTKSSGMAYKEFTRSYNGSHIFAKWIQQQSAAGEKLYLGVIQPESMSLSINTGLTWWNMDITYELLGNIPTTDKTTAKLGETVTTTVNRIISDSSTTLNYKIGETVIASENIGTATSHSFTIPESAGSAFPNSATATMTVEAVTSQSGTEYGTLSTSFTVTLPEDASPTATMNVSRVWQDTVPSASQIAAYVQKQAGASASITGAAKYGASIASVKLSAEGSEYKSDTASATFTHLPFTGSGNITLTATVTDTRGNAGTTSETVNVLPWSPPTIQAFTIQRATDAGAIAIDGTCAQADATASVSSLMTDAEKNALTFTIQYREIGAADWIGADAITATDISSTISGLLTSGGTILDTFNDMSGYEFRLGVSDLYATGYASDQMPTKEQFWDVDEATGKMGFGGDAPTSEESAGYRFHKPVEFKEGYKTYSTTETDTGNKWIDGKPIYRVVITGTTTLCGGQGVVATLPSLIGSPVNIRVFTNDGTNLNWRPLSFAQNTSNYNWNASFYIRGGKEIVMCYGSNWAGTKSFIIIAEYTKGA